MDYRLLNPFDQRQVMRRQDFEIFHYNNPACCFCPPHQHDFFELFFLLDDSLDDIVEGIRYSMVSGNAMLVAPGQLHRPDVTGPTRSIDRFVLWISTEYVRSITDALPRLHYALWGDLTGRNLILPDADTSALMRQLLFALHREDARPEADSASMARNIIAQLLIHCSRSVASQTDIVPHKAELRYREIMRVYEHIVANLPDRNLTVSALAEQFFMDKNTLTRQFKRQVGMTPGECIRRHRLEAVRMKIRRGVPMQQACAECGFSDYSAFYCAFRQAYGISPRDYAAQAGGATQTGEKRQEAAMP